jgi:hypothetical protein
MLPFISKYAHFFGVDNILIMTELEPALLGTRIYHVVNLTSILVFIF